MIKGYDETDNDAVDDLKELIKVMTEEHDVTLPWNRILVSHNKFKNNQVDTQISFIKARANQPQVSSVYVIGGIDTQFTYN